FWDEIVRVDFTYPPAMYATPGDMKNGRTSRGDFLMDASRAIDFVAQSTAAAVAGAIPGPRNIIGSLPLLPFAKLFQLFAGILHVLVSCFAVVQTRENWFSGVSPAFRVPGPRLIRGIFKMSDLKQRRQVIIRRPGGFPQLGLPAGELIVVVQSPG